MNNPHGSNFPSSHRRTRRDAALARVEANPEVPRRAGSFLSSRLAEGLRRGWRWVALGGVGAGLLGFLGGVWQARHAAVATVIWNEAPTTLVEGEHTGAEPVRDRALETLIGVARSPELMRRVAAVSGARVTPDRLAAESKVENAPKTGLVRFEVRRREAGEAVRLANAYAGEAVRFTQELREAEVKRVKSSLEARLAGAEEELRAATEELAAFQRGLGMVDFGSETARELRQFAELEARLASLGVQLQTLDTEMASLQQQISQHHPALLAMRQALDEALLRFTEEHPKVKELRARMASLEARVAEQQDPVDPEIALNGSSLAQNLYTRVIELRTQRATVNKELEAVQALRMGLRERLSGLPGKQLEHARLKSRIEVLEAAREQLLRHRAQIETENSAWGYRVLQPARADDVPPVARWMTGLRAGAAAGLLGCLATCLLVLCREVSNRRIRSENDLSRATGLPVLAVLPDLRKMSVSERETWAFRTLTALQARLSAPNKPGFVCAVTSATSGEGRSTWVNLLAEAANRKGHRVLTVFANRLDPTLPSGEDVASTEPRPERALAAPAKLAEALTTPGAQPSLEIALPGWVWIVERRKQWQEALRQLRSVENVVVLVELPPASRLEAALLSENGCPVVWLCRKDATDADEARGQVTTLSESGGDLVGAVFNLAQRPRGEQRRASLTLVLGLAWVTWAGTISAQDTQPTQSAEDQLGAKPTGALSVTGPENLAPWQQRLTLGPGDVVSINIYDEPDTLRPGLAIGPDGRLNYLQARDVEAAGLTVDELRQKLESALEKFYRPPIRVIVIPEAYTSKRYYILGGVAQKGVFVLDRPVTIVEAIARARGFETTFLQRNTLMLADLSRSFLVRKEADATFRRVEVDFEALFLRADLSQNLTLAPDDYLYFPPLDLKEVYVLGQVGSPGVVPYTPELTVIRAVISRGSFTERAYKKKILVVRGSLTRPETFIVDGAAILDARGTDFPLRPRDIVYVNARPWARVEELLQFAILDYMRAIVIAWTGQNVGPFTKEPFIPNID